MGKSKENEMQTSLITGERFNGLRNGASHTFSSRLRSVIRYPLRSGISDGVGICFQYRTALCNQVHAPDGRIILSRGGCVLLYSWIYPQSGINCDWSCVILLIFLSAAIATTAGTSERRQNETTNIVLAAVSAFAGDQYRICRTAGRLQQTHGSCGKLVYLSIRAAPRRSWQSAARLAAKARYFGLKLRTPLDFAAVYVYDGRLEYDAEQEYVT